MKNVAYICGYYNFPRGSASANYVQYLGLALKDIGYKIVLITNINKEELDPFYQAYGDIFEIRSYDVRKCKIGRYIDINYLMGKYIDRELKLSVLSPGDLLISYSFDKSINSVLLSYAKKYKITSIVCVVEFFEKKDFSQSLFENKYRKYAYIMNYLIPKFDIIFPISTYIENYYKRNKKKVFRLPIMANPFEYEYQEVNIFDKLRFVYPANGKMKDAITNMLLSLNCFTDDELKKLEFHFCGVKKSVIENKLSERLKKHMGSSIIIHDWMKYHELVKLYQSSDFLFLAREKRQMTFANFPSKVPEVMCYGVIPVVSRVGDYTSLYLRDGVNSIIFEGCDVQACQSAIRRCLLLSIIDRMNLRNAARQTSIDVFYYKNWENIILKAITEPESNCNNEKISL